MAVVITSCMPWKRCLYFEESHKANLCQHFICKHSLWNLWFNSFILYYLVTPWLERRFRQGETLTSEDCHLVFSPLFFFFYALRDGFNYLLLRRTEEGFHEKIHTRGHVQGWGKVFKPDPGAQKSLLSLFEQHSRAKMVTLGKQIQQQVHLCSMGEFL